MPPGSSVDAEHQTCRKAAARLEHGAYHLDFESEKGRALVARSQECGKKRCTPWFLRADVGVVSGERLGHVINKADHLPILICGMRG